MNIIKEVRAAEREKEMDVNNLRAYIGKRVTLHGSIYKIRKMSGFSFVILRTARYTVQCVCDSPRLLPLLQDRKSVV